MPIDPQIQAMFANIEIPPVRAVPIAEMRRIVSSSAAAPHPEDRIASVEDRTIPGPHGAVPLRVYTPEGTGPFPVAIFLHSGGFVLGDLDSEDAIARAVAAQAGALTISVDYRLAPEHVFPAPVDDAYAAVEWAAKHATELGGDPQRLAIVGTSAGGVLAAAIALRARDQGGPRLAGFVNFYGSCNYPSELTPSAREFADGIVLKTDDIDYYYNMYLGDAALQDHPEASPLRAPDHRGLPPAFVGTAECDPSRDDAEAFAHKLEAAGVPTLLRRYPGMIHGFLSFQGFHPVARGAILDIARWLEARFAEAGAHATSAA